MSLGFGPCPESLMELRSRLLKYENKINSAWKRVLHQNILSQQDTGKCKKTDMSLILEAKDLTFANANVRCSWEDGLKMDLRDIGWGGGGGVDSPGSG
jgi:hypothetical protein